MAHLIEKDQIEEYILLDMKDCPPSYAGQALKVLRVKETEDGLEFFTPEAPSFVGLIEEKSFEFRDLDYEQLALDQPQTYVLDVKATYDYQIESIVFQIETGTLTGLRVWIAEAPVAPFDAIVIEGGLTETATTEYQPQYHKRTVNKGESVMFSVRGFTTDIGGGGPTYLRGKLITKRL